MSPKVKVLLALIICIAATVALIVYSGDLATRFGWSMPTGHGRSGEEILTLLLVAPIAIFTIGAIFLWLTIHRSMAKGWALLVALLFATFPVWFVPIVAPIAVRAWDKLYPRVHPAREQTQTALLMQLQEARYADDGTRVTLNMRFRLLPRSDSVSGFDLKAFEPMNGWSIDRESKHSGQVTAVRVGKTFDYYETDTHQQLVQPDRESIMFPLVLKRQSHQTTQLPRELKFYIREGTAETVQTFPLTVRSPAPLVIFSDVSYTDDGTRLTIFMRIQPVVSTSDVGRFELQVADNWRGWKIDGGSNHSGRVTAVRAGSGFHYEEANTHEPLAETDDQSIVLPVVFQRESSLDTRLPPDIQVLIQEDRGRSGFASAAWWFPFTAARRIPNP